MPWNFIPVVFLGGMVFDFEIPQMGYLTLKISCLCPVGMFLISQSKFFSFTLRCRNTTDKFTTHFYNINTAIYIQ